MTKNRYSYSRIESFSQCRLQYKYRYVDRLKTKVETIEALMGNRVHEALRDLYEFVKNKVVKPKEWLLSRYESLWEEKLHDSIKVVKKELTAEDYYQKGRQCLIDYYDEHQPFDRTKIVKLEESMYFTLKRGDEEFTFTGTLDRLDWDDKAKRFEIHDYKTSSSLMSQQEADEDLQLALYQIALTEKWLEAEKAKLVWHFLLFNKQLESTRTRDQLIEAQDKVIDRIKAIETCQDFPPNKTFLCDWCGYQDICPLWKHPHKVEKLDANQYLKDSGVKLVSRYAELEEEKKELKKKISEIEQDQEKIEEAALRLAEQENIRVIDGPDHQLQVTLKDVLSAPTRREDEEKWESLRAYLIEKNRYVDVSTVNNNMLNRMLKEWPPDFIDKIKNFLIKKVIRKVDLKKKT
jgi:putative RecB family exonuclease